MLGEFANPGVVRAAHRGFNDGPAGRLLLIHTIGFGEQRQRTVSSSVSRGVMAVTKRHQFDTTATLLLGYTLKWNSAITSPRNVTAPRTPALGRQRRLPSIVYRVSTTARRRSE
jgi:hypothetical protein